MQLHSCGPLYLEWEGWKQCSVKCIESPKLPHTAKRQIDVTDIAK